MFRVAGRVGHGRQWMASLIAATLVLAGTAPAQAIIIRHDVDDTLYLQEDDAYPAVFQIFDQRGGVATLIAPQWALTVAHVARDTPQGHAVTIAGQSYVVAQVILHPDWGTSRMDMALLQLDRPVEAVVPVPPYEQDGETGQVVTLVGRGDTGTGLTGPVTRDQRLRAATNRVERIEGDMLVFRFDAPTDENVTPLEGISGPGDSGGPALIQTADGPRLAGLSVAQSGRPKGTYGVWEFYTRVSPQLTWVREVVPPPDEAETGETQAREGATGALGLRTALYTGLAAAAGLAMIASAWAYRRRRTRPS